MGGGFNVASYDEVKAAIASLWSEEIERWEADEAEIDGALDEAHRRVARLERAIEETGQRIGLLGGELEQLPLTLARADLASDEAGRRLARTRYSELQEEIAQLRERLESDRAALADARAGLPELERKRHLLRRERIEKLQRQHREYAALRAALEGRARDIGLLDFAHSVA